MACQFTCELDLHEVSQSSMTDLGSIDSFDTSPEKRGFREPVLLKSTSDLSSASESNIKIKLPRGGSVIQTRIGPIQFSMVPETVKDSLNLGLEVPTIYIMPTHRFDKQFCLSVSEFEFPAYFNFFVKKRKVILVCDKDGETAVRTIFQETLLGPNDFSKFNEDFAVDYKGAPDIQSELKHFAKNPFNPTEPLTVDLLISFVLFDSQGIADLGQGIQVKKKAGRFHILDSNKEIARIKDKVDIMIDTSKSDEYIKYGLFANPQLEQAKGCAFREKFIEQQFQPPCFGITILGCSHGFDPKGSTSGYIIWVNGRGVMVDPPPYSTLLLRQMGVPSSFIKWVIVSHTHADHDAGTFQKLLESEKVELITTKTIMESFVRKYAAMTNFSADYIKTLFAYRPAIVGRPIRVNGAEFYFHYSLHSIPCIGFTVKMLDKSIYFSGDTFYEPDGIKKMFENGVLTKDRHDQLLCDKKWNNTLILHEAGVPPIHTPCRVLAQLPSEVKQRIKLIHVAAKDIPADSELSTPATGIENTIILIDQSTNEKLQIIKSLNLIQNIHLFAKASFRHIRDIYEVIYEKVYQKGERICSEGEVGDEFYIIKKGSIMIHSDDEKHRFVRYLYEGDYFGEACFFDRFQRTANATAVTDDTHLMIVQKDDFLYIFGEKEQESNIMTQLFGLQEFRNKNCSLISKNKFFSQLSSSQKQELELLLNHPSNFRQGSVLWTAGVKAEYAFFVVSGKVKIVVPSAYSITKDSGSPVKLHRREEEKKNLLKRGSVPVAFTPVQFEQLRKTKDTDNHERARQESQIFIYGEGTFVGEVEALMNQKRLSTIVEVVEDAQLIIIKHDAFNSFLSSNPGLQVLFKDSLIVE